MGLPVIIWETWISVEESENQYNCMIHHLEIMNICTEFHGIAVKTFQNVLYMTWYYTDRLKLYDSGDLDKIWLQYIL